MSKRGEQWKRFSGKVLEHIEDYTVPQYGDAPDDMAANFTVKDMVTQMQKYLLRQSKGGGQRGIEEDKRDFLKIAHYAAMAYDRLNEMDISRD